MSLLLEGPRHFLAFITRVATYCTEEEVAMLKPYIQYNGYFAQHEVVLASPLASEEREEREVALQVVKKLQKKEERSKRKTVRKVKNPEIDLAATTLSELVDLKQATSSPPSSSSTPRRSWSSSWRSPTASLTCPAPPQLSSVG